MRTDARGAEQIEAAFALVDMNEKVRESLWEAVLTYELAILEGLPERIRQSLRQLIRATMTTVTLRAPKEAQRLAGAAASRNIHKGDWRRCSIRTLVDKLYEEVQELNMALMVKEPRERVLEEAGDVLWTGIMIADHGLHLGWIGVQEVS